MSGKSVWRGRGEVKAEKPPRPSAALFPPRPAADTRGLGAEAPWPLSGCRARESTPGGGGTIGRIGVGIWRGDVSGTRSLRKEYCKKEWWRMVWKAE